MEQEGGISPNSTQGQQALYHLYHPFRYNNQTQAIFGEVGNGLGDIGGLYNRPLA